MGTTATATTTTDPLAKVRAEWIAYWNAGGKLTYREFAANHGHRI